MTKTTLRIEYIPLSKMTRFSDNPKLHDIQALVEAFKKYGFQDPPKWDSSLNGGEGALVEGNGRQEALQWMKQQGQPPPVGIAIVDDDWAIPVLFGNDLESESLAQLYAIDHNNLVLLGGDFTPLDMAGLWDKDGYNDLLNKLGKQDEFSISVDGDSLDFLLGLNDNPPKETEPLIDKAEELQEKWQVEPGDIWQLGEHFIICGDCREPETWQRLLSAAEVDKINGVFTSPPYAEQRKKQYGGVPTAEYVEWWEAVQENVKDNLADDGSFFVNIKNTVTPNWLERNLYTFDLVISMKRNWGWYFIDDFCWLRSGIPGQITYRFKNGFESIYHFAKGKSFKIRPDSVSLKSFNVPVPGGIGTGHVGGLDELAGTSGSIFGSNKTKEGFAYPNNVLPNYGGDRDTKHAAPFPLKLPTFFIKAYSDPADIWLDPFLGSGTTICAAHNEGRRGLGIERLEKYCAVTLERFLEHTGITPIKL